MKDELKAYKARFAEAEAVIASQRRSASLELRWQQLNAAFEMGKLLELPREDHSEIEVIERWAKLKENAANQPRKV